MLYRYVILLLLLLWRILFFFSCMLYRLGAYFDSTYEVFLFCALYLYLFNILFYFYKHDLYTWSEISTALTRHDTRTCFLVFLWPSIFGGEFTFFVSVLLSSQTQVRTSVNSSGRCSMYCIVSSVELWSLLHINTWLGLKRSPLLLIYFTHAFHFKRVFLFHTRFFILSQRRRVRHCPRLVLNSTLLVLELYFFKNFGARGTAELFLVCLIAAEIWDQYQ